MTEIKEEPNKDSINIDRCGHAVLALKTHAGQSVSCVCDHTSKNTHLCTHMLTHGD